MSVDIGFYRHPAMGVVVRRGFVAAVLGAGSVLSHAANVSTDFSFGSYQGPLGRLVEDPSYYIDTYFVVNGGSPQLQAPTVPYTTGPAANNPLVGTGTVNLRPPGSAAVTSVDFYVGYFGVDPTGAYSVHNTFSMATATTTNAVVGSTIKLGTLSFQNGNWLVGDGTQDVPAQLSFSFSTASSDPTLNNHVWSDTLVYTTRSVTGGTLDENADVISFANSPALGTWAVRDGMSASIDIYGKVGSLIPLYLANPSIGSFVVAAVPEPETWAFMLAGLGLLAWRHQRCGSKA